MDLPVSCWQLYLCNGKVRAAELLTSPSPLQVSSILPLSEVRLPGWSGSCSAGQAAEELQFSSHWWLSEVSFLLDDLKIAGWMAWILTAAVAPVSYLEEQLGFTCSSVTFKKSLALPSWSRSAGARAPVAPGWDNLPPHRS